VLPDGDLLVGDLYRIQKLHMAAPALLVILTPSGTYEGQVEVAGFQAAYVTGVVRYTLDGSDPSPMSPAFAGERFVLHESTTLKARVFVNDNPVSEVVEARYVVVPVAPSMVQAPQAASVMEGDYARLAVTARGTSPLIYQWFKDGREVPSATGTELVFAAAALTDAGSYTVRVTNALGAVTSDPAVLTVTPRPKPPVITQQPADQAVVVDGTAVFRIEVTGDPPLQFDWRRNGLPVPGGAREVLTLEHVQKSQAGLYAVRVSNPHGAAVSRNARLTVADQPVPPTIVSGPQSFAKFEGQSANLQVTATGTLPLRFQWTRNGQPIVGATAASLEFAQLQLSDAGTYAVTVSNDGGSAVSPSALVEVHPVAPGGLVVFNNFVPLAGVDAPVFDADGTTRLAGEAYLAQLYAGPTAETLVPAGGALPFQTGPASGYVALTPSGNVVTLMAVPPGGVAFVQMRAWEAAGGSSFEQAMTAGAKTGVSGVIQVVTGGAPPQFPADLAGLASFSIRNEAVPPVVVITSPVAGTTADERFRLAGTIRDNASVVSASWTWNGTDQGSVTLEGTGNFQLAGRRLVLGENRIVVSARDAAGNSGAAEVTVTWEPLRWLALGPVAPLREGRQAVIPVTLTSRGEISGLTFLLHYDPDRFQDAQFAWTGAQELWAAFTQVSQDVAGEVRATLSLPGGTAPNGNFPLAELILRARSVAKATSSLVVPQLLDMADSTGTRLDFGNAALRTAVEVLPRLLVGDHNGNDFLDVGDATLIQRLVARIDPAQPWDVTGNDLNGSGDLDSGDIVKILRIIVGLDLGPQSVPGSSRGLAATPPAPAALMLTATPDRVLPGETVRLRVNLSSGPEALSGLAFRLSYPANRLRLAGERGYETGEAIPTGTATVWNSEPDAGRIWFAAAGPRSWEPQDEAVAEFEFEVLAGEGAAEDIAVGVEGGQLAADQGYEVHPTPAATALVVSAVPRLDASVRPGPQGWEIGCWTAPGMRYTIEASIDLDLWQELGVLVGNGEVQKFLDLDARTLAARFYRVRVSR
jgi:hypothetical protein